MTSQQLAIAIAITAGIISAFHDSLGLVDRIRKTRWYARLVSNQASDRPLFSPYLIRSEILIITGIGILANYVGVLLTSNLRSVLFFDMIGTAFTSYLLGPWWGAAVGLLSSSFINFVAYPGNGAEKIIFPWALVNMAGALFWGYCAQRTTFKRYIASPDTTVVNHLAFLTVFGGLSSFVMSIPGAFVQVAINGDDWIMQNSQVARAIHGLSTALLLHNSGSEQLLYNWLAQSVYSIPDKAITAALALAVIRVALPLYERELIHGSPGRSVSDRGYLSTIALAAFYFPFYLTIIRNPIYSFSSYWPLWTAPWIVMVMRLGAVFFTARPRQVKAAVLTRREHYDNVQLIVRENIVHEFYGRFVTATWAASFLFLLSLPLLQVPFYSVAINFLFAVNAMSFALYVLQIAVGQNALVPSSVASVSKIWQHAGSKVIGEIQMPGSPEIEAKSRLGVSKTPALLEISVPDLHIWCRGHVNHLFECEDKLLMIASDRVVAFDRVLPVPIPGKGIEVMKMSVFWFRKLRSAKPSHFLASEVSDLPKHVQEQAVQYKGRWMLIQPLQMIPIDFVVRGYLFGSAWAEYNERGTVWGQSMDSGLPLGFQFKDPIFTPRTKASTGHAEPVSVEELSQKFGRALIDEIREWSLELFREASAHCRSRNVLLCDSKFEFGFARNPVGSKQLVLADEILTPDSSRFIKAEDFESRRTLQHWDRQLLEDYLLAVGWNAIDPAPPIPQSFVEGTAERFRELSRLITS